MDGRGGGLFSRDGGPQPRPTPSPKSAPPHGAEPTNLREASIGSGAICPELLGDGSDDLQASQRLSISPHTVNTHRKAIMGKLKLHHKGQLMMHALQQGYVRVTPGGIFYPGFQRRLQLTAKVPEEGKAEAVSA